jgi:hypothetical protein
MTVQMVTDLIKDVQRSSDRRLAYHMHQWHAFSVARAQLRVIATYFVFAMHASLLSDMQAQSKC